MSHRCGFDIPHLLITSSCNISGVKRLSYVDMKLLQIDYISHHMSYIRGEEVILCRHETSPEDIVGMKSAVGILTMRGGMTSHAGVICR
jgi:phosphoenolpyruvate-protein kinase (PTS system EI component)